MIEIYKDSDYQGSGERFYWVLFEPINGAVILACEQYYDSFQQAVSAVEALKQYLAGSEIPGLPVDASKASIETQKIINKIR